MKKVFSFAIINIVLLIGLVSCAPQTATTPTSQSNDLALSMQLTSVPATISAAQTEAYLQGQMDFNATEVALRITQTAGAPTESNTEIPTETEAAAIFSETPTALATNTPAAITTALFTATAAPTKSGTATNTLVPNYTPGTTGRGTNGSTTLSDDFDSAGNWTLYENATTKTKIKDGNFIFEAVEKYTITQWTVSRLSMQNFYAEVYVETPATCEAKDRYGMTFRALDVNQLYIFLVSCDGKYQLASWDGTNYELLVYWTASNAINKGANKANILGVRAIGDEITLYVNDSQLVTVTDAKFETGGRFGLAIGSEDTENFTVEFDDLRIWRINP